MPEARVTRDPEVITVHQIPGAKVYLRPEETSVAPKTWDVTRSYAFVTVGAMYVTQPI